MMTVFANVLSAPIEADADTIREDIFQVCRELREQRVARLSLKDLRAFRRTL